MSLRIVNVDPRSEVALILLKEAAVEVRALYDAVLPAERPWPTNAPSGQRDVYVVAFWEEQPVACGALREVDGQTAEVRRMYVRPDRRRHHVAHRVLSYLIEQATSLGYQRLRLETGNRQEPAIALYEGFGFRRVEPFEPHADDPTSVCFEMQLGESPR